MVFDAGDLSLVGRVQTSGNELNIYITDGDTNGADSTEVSDDAQNTDDTTNEDPSDDS